MDYEDEDDIRRLAGLIERLAQRPSYQESSMRFEKWILGVLGLLAVSTIGGGIAVYGRFTSLETKVEEWKGSVQRQIDMNAQRIERLENRR